ncbi:MAG: AmmeMemoRadiSam system protein B [Gammaproteobacteria bacterium]|nr:AmmeMemoRadiSam system protein B [Gammaproteobacteria bacterium]
MLTREPAVAGTFYPADSEVLQQTVSGLLGEAEAKNDSSASIKAMIVPHAGYIYSGELAAQAYASLNVASEKIKTVVLLGPAHKVYFRGLAAPVADEFKTPLGEVPIDQNAIEALLEKFPFVQRLSQAHRDEHSLEVQLPFLQEVLKDFCLIPLVVGDSRPDQVDKVIDYLWGDESTLLVISSDLSHFHDYPTAQSMDGQTANAIETLQPQILSGEFACGFLPVSGLILAARRRQMWPERVGLCNSGDTAGDKSRVVGYGAWLFRERPVQQQVLSDEQKDSLKKLSLASIRHGLETGEPLSVDAYIDEKGNGEKLPDYQAATFVTLKKNGQLRGCIGSLSAYRSLPEDVAENAFAAAFRDHRFTPLTEDELDEIEISISVLTAPELMVFTSEQDLISQLQPFVDGIILTEGGNRGTFLPSVWENYPEPASFLSHLKLKAGLPADYWSGTMKIERYKTISW